MFRPQARVFSSTRCVHPRPLRTGPKLSPAARRRRQEKGYSNQSIIAGALEPQFQPAGLRRPAAGAVVWPWSRSSVWQLARCGSLGFGYSRTLRRVVRARDSRTYTQSTQTLRHTDTLTLIHAQRSPFFLFARTRARGGSEVVWGEWSGVTERQHIVGGGRTRCPRCPCVRRVICQ